MRGSLTQRYKGSWSIILDLGDQLDPQTGLQKRKQRWHTFRGTRKQAEDKLADLLKEIKDDAYVEASDLTLGAWLEEWLAAAAGGYRLSTRDHYRHIIRDYVTPAPLGQMRLQTIRETHIERYYASLAEQLAPASLGVHHALLHRAFRKAVKTKLIPRNPASDLDYKPRRKREDGAGTILAHCWTASEAQAFLIAATAAGPQPAAFYNVALDSGMRKSELCGLQWPTVDLDEGTVRVVQQLLRRRKHTPRDAPLFGPTKTGRPRTIRLAPETLDLLRRHRQAQREQKMAHRPTFVERDLVFTKDDGSPLQANNLGQREYARLITAAGVKRIKFHGLRHTCATLLLQARVPVHVVSERLGHASVSMTMEVYAHVLPDMQKEAADTIGTLLHPKTSLAIR